MQCFKNPNLFAHCAVFFFIVEEESSHKLHCNNASWMATRKQVSHTLKSIWPTKQMQISLLFKNTRKYVYHCGRSLCDVFVFNKPDFIQHKSHMSLMGRCSTIDWLQYGTQKSKLRYTSKIELKYSTPVGFKNWTEEWYTGTVRFQNWTKVWYAGTVRFQNWTEVRYADTVRLKVPAT